MASLTAASSAVSSFSHPPYGKKNEKKFIFFCFLFLEVTKIQEVGIYICPIHKQKLQET
jgi:hypothetical protein